MEGSPAADLDAALASTRVPAPALGTAEAPNADQRAPADSELSFTFESAHVSAAVEAAIGAVTTATAVILEATATSTDFHAVIPEIRGLHDQLGALLRSMSAAGGSEVKDGADSSGECTSTCQEV
jgi:hypothetical protein